MARKHVKSKRLKIKGGTKGASTSSQTRAPRRRRIGVPAPPPGLTPKQANEYRNMVQKDVINPVAADKRLSGRYRV